MYIMIIIFISCFICSLLLKSTNYIYIGENTSSMFEKYVYSTESYTFLLTFFVTKKYILPATDI
jgi:hypothetical protein